MLLYLLRRYQLSLGLPLAYLGSLLLIHVPGAFAHLVAADRMRGNEFVETGTFYTAIGCVCFVAGVWLARATTRPPQPPQPANRRAFAYFCLIGGWLFVYGLSPLARISSFGAVIETAAAPSGCLARCWACALRSRRVVFSARSSGPPRWPSIRP